jgi:biotin carboxyl carrier protein
LATGAPIEHHRWAPAWEETAIGLSIDELTTLLNAFDQSGWNAMNLSIDGTRVEITRGRGDAQAPTGDADRRGPAPAPPEVTAPSVGVFHRGTGPGAPRLVELGDDVEPGDILGIVQVHTRTQRVVAGASGSIGAIHAEDGEWVQYGQVLLTIEGHS